jgi:hypothetical protein
MDAQMSSDAQDEEVNKSAEKEEGKNRLGQIFE